MPQPDSHRDDVRPLAGEAVPRRAATCRWRARVAAIAALALLPIAATGGAPDAWPPQTLRDTGLYADFESKTVRPENLPFSPQYPLWTDGAAKSRWIFLPPGTSIDGSAPSAWRFPVGVRLWKEFRFGRRAETRLLELTRRGWQFATYVWNDDESEAVLAPERGVAESVPIGNGVHHAIPSRIDCQACHEADTAPVLGFSALQLSPDRDPNAPHAEARPSGAIDLPGLVERGLLRNLPSHYLERPPRIAAPTATARAALGYLHANCGMCHNRVGPMASLGMSLTYLLGRPEGEPPAALWTTAGQPSQFKVPDVMDLDAEQRIFPGDPDRSVLVARMSSRDPFLQMPPLGTRLVDGEAIELIRRWITSDVPAHQMFTRREEKE